VSKYIAVEPNTYMHPRIRAAATRVGFTEAAGSFNLLACGAEDIEAIRAAAGGSVDTIVAVLVICSIPTPQDTLRKLVRDVLASSGELLFYEHVRNDIPAVAACQGFLNPLWRSSGCNINRPTDKWIEGLGAEDMWREGQVQKVHTVAESGLFPERWGRFVKA
jgi:hypothetical protein